MLGHLWVCHDFTFPLLTYWILEVFSNCIFYNCEGTLLGIIIFKYPTIKGVNFDLAFVNMIIFKYPTIYILHDHLHSLLNTVHKIIQSNYNAKIMPIYFLDNYGGSADQLVILKIIVTYNWPGQTWLWYQKGGKLHKLRIRRLGTETR